MNLETKKSLHDVLAAAREIGEYTAGFDFPAYQKNGMAQAAVERKFEIIGEALNRIARLDPNNLAKISDSQRIIGFRNIIAHGYDMVDIEIVWDAVKHYLPVLVREIEALLSEK